MAEQESAAGSALTKGGVTGEMAKRASNQITNGAVKTANSFRRTLLNQSGLGSVQNAAGSIASDVIDGLAPDLNRAGKLAVDGAVNGLIASPLHRAVVPSETRSAKGIVEAGNGNPNAHSLPKHGKQTTREQQLERVNTGQAPDGTIDKKLRDSSKMAQECGSLRWAGSRQATTGRKTSSGPKF